MTEISITTQYLGAYTPSEEEFWDEVELEFNSVTMLLTRTHVETEEEALSGKFRGRKGSDTGGMEIIRRRNVGWSFDQLDHYLQIGQTLLPRASQLLEERQFTIEFVRIWMDLQVCHGFLIAHYMDNSDDLTAHRGGASVPKEIEIQKKWLCHYLAVRINSGRSLVDASSEALEEVNRRIKSCPTGAYDSSWYERMISKKTGDFTSSLRVTHQLSKSEILRIARSPSDDIPPL